MSTEVSFHHSEPFANGNFEANNNFQMTPSDEEPEYVSGHTISSLNDDCLVEIFKNLDIRERLRLELVCKRWQKCLYVSVDRLKICFSSEFLAIYTNANVHSEPNCNALQLRYYDESFAEGLLKFAKKFIRCQIGHLSVQFTYPSYWIEYFQRKFKNLSFLAYLANRSMASSLSIDGDGLPSFFDILPSEFCREVRQCRFGSQNFNHHSGEVRRRHCGHFVNLTDLDVNAAEIVAFVDARLPKLRKLTLRNAARLNLAAWNQFQRHYHAAIVDLDVEVRDLCRHPAVFGLLDRFSSLRRLAVHYVSSGENIEANFSGSLVSQLAANCKLLSNLSVTLIGQDNYVSNPRYVHHLMEAIGEISGLRSLHVDFDRLEDDVLLPYEGLFAETREEFSLEDVEEDGDERSLVACLANAATVRHLTAHFDRRTNQHQRSLDRRSWSGFNRHFSSIESLTAFCYDSALSDFTGLARLRSLVLYSSTAAYFRRPLRWTPIRAIIETCPALTYLEAAAHLDVTEQAVYELAVLAQQRPKRLTLKFGLAARRRGAIERLLETATFWRNQLEVILHDRPEGCLDESDQEGGLDEILGNLNGSLAGSLAASLSGSLSGTFPLVRTGCAGSDDDDEESDDSYYTCSLDRTSSCLLETAIIADVGFGGGGGGYCNGYSVNNNSLNCSNGYSSGYASANSDALNGNLAFLDSFEDVTFIDE